MKAVTGDVTRDRDASSRARFAADVQYYLTQDPRQLPSEYLYDDLGSALFAAICRLPWYPLTRTEIGLLTEHASAILASASETIVELGPGNGEKLAALLAAADPRGYPRAIHLVDVSRTALAEAAGAMQPFAGIEVSLNEATYDAGLAAFAETRSNRGRAMLMFLGSNIGNFDPPGRDAFLRSIRGALSRGDRLLLGADLIKSEPLLVTAYDDPLGVTAAFNRNLLVRINRELGANFQLDAFSHVAAWNATDARVEMHLRCDCPQDVVIQAAGLEFAMRQGESIWTESSYKFTPQQIARLLGASGFRLLEQWMDPAAQFALTYAEAA